jgi:hypothetical protein
MSATTPLHSLDVQEQISRIDRALAETQKLQRETEKYVAEQSRLIAEEGKLRAEQQKLFAEDGKLRAETTKFRRDPWFIIVGALIGALATQLPALLRGLGLIAG